MTQQTGCGSDAPGAKASSIVDTSETDGDARQEEAGAGGVHGSPGIVTSESPTTPAEVSNTENVFEEEHTEGFNRAPTGSGDLEEQV